MPSPTSCSLLERKRTAIQAGNERSWYCQLEGKLLPERKSALVFGYTAGKSSCETKSKWSCPLQLSVSKTTESKQSAPTAWGPSFCMLLSSFVGCSIGENQAYYNRGTYSSFREESRVAEPGIDPIGRHSRILYTLCSQSIGTYCCQLVERTWETSTSS